MKDKQVSLILNQHQNPLARLYGLFDKPCRVRVDDPTYLGVEGLGIEELKSEGVRQLIPLLRRREDAALRVGELKFDHLLIVNFAAGPVEDWLQRETLEEMGGADEMCASCFGLLSDWQLNFEDYQDGVEWTLLSTERDPEAALVSALGHLAECRGCAGRWTLSAVCEKAPLVDNYLIAPFPHLIAKDTDLTWHSKVTALIWHGPERMQQAFDSFTDFLDFIGPKACRPLVLFFYEQTPAFTGDYFKVLPLGGAAAAGDEGAAIFLTEQLETLDAEAISDCQSLYQSHLRESRRGDSERLDLPPLILLARKSSKDFYPSDSALFSEGPLRSLLVYALMAWLAEITNHEEGVTRFTLPATGDKSAVVALAFTLADVKLDGVSIFQPAQNWQAIVGLIAREIAACAGNEIYRAQWADAFKKFNAEAFTVDKFFTTLEAVRKEFLKIKERTTVIKSLPPEVVELQIFIEADARGRKICFTLHSNNPDLGFFHSPAGSIPLDEAHAEAAYAELSRLARDYLKKVLDENPAARHAVVIGAPTKAAVPSRRRLDSIGLELWEKLIPKELKSAYVRIRELQDSVSHPEMKNVVLFIVSDDPAFPWELVKPFEDVDSEITRSGIDDDWWAIEMGIARWLTGSPPPVTTITLDRICVITDLSLPATVREREFFEGLGIEVRFPQTKEKLFELLGSESYGALHFGCHGDFKQTQPAASEILLPDGSTLKPEELFDKNIKRMLNKRRPLVFLNACHTGRTGAALIGLEGWAKQFVTELKCGAFIGCGWEVTDSLAADFAVTFYQNFLKGETLSQATHEARQRIMEMDNTNSTGLAYYLYGNPNCRIK